MRVWVMIAAMMLASQAYAADVDGTTSCRAVNDAVAHDDRAFVKQALAVTDKVMVGEDAKLGHGTLAGLSANDRRTLQVLPLSICEEDESKTLTDAAGVAFRGMAKLLEGRF